MSAKLLLHVFPSFAMGGVQARSCALANAFGGGFRHAIVALDGRREAASRLDASLDVVWPEAGLRRGDWAGNVARCRALLRALRPHALVTSNWGSIEWALAALGGPARHVHVEDGFGPEERSGQLARRVWMRRLALRRATVVLPSRTLLALARDRWRLPRRRLRYVPNGVPVARYAGPRLPAPPDWPQGEAPLIGTVAALRPEKNISRLLQAVARMARPARLVIVGDGPERGSLQREAQALGLGARVHFAGHLDAPDEAYRRFDLFALASDTEQMPLSLLEAMASGLAVAATDVGDVRAMLDPLNADAVVTRDAGALAAALDGLVAAPARAAAIGAANRRRAAAEFDQARMVSAWRDILDGSETREHAA